MTLSLALDGGIVTLTLPLDAEVVASESHHEVAGYQGCSR